MKKLLLLALLFQFNNLFGQINETVYVGTSEGKLLALDALKGTEKWNVQTGFFIVSSPTISNNVVYVGSDDSNIYAVDSKTGVKKWVIQVFRAYIETSPIVIDGVLYIGCSNGKLYAFDAKSGTLKWEFDSGYSGIKSSPTVANGLVYFGSSNGKVHAVDILSGLLKWEYSCSEVKSSPTVINGILYVGCIDRNLYALDAIKGTLKWKYYSGAAIESSPVVVNNLVYFGSNDGKLYSIDAITGLKKWEFVTQRGIYSSPTVANNIVFVCSYDEKIYAVDALTGLKKWEFATGHTMDSSPTYANGFIYCGSYDKFYSLNAKTGKKEWEFYVGDGINSSAAVIDNLGKIFHSSISGVETDYSCLPKIKVNTPNGTGFCQGDMLQISAEASGTTSPFSYQWKSAGVDIATTQSLNISKVGTYEIEVTDKTNCVVATTIDITQKPQPDVNITANGSTGITTGGSVILSVPSVSNQTYQWRKDGVSLTDGTKNTYNATSAGDYSVLVTLNGCSATSSIVKVTIVLANELPYASIDFDFYPNPSSDVINLKLNEYLKQSVTLHLSNLAGTNMKDWVVKETGINSLNISGLASGIYVIHGEINDRKVSIKIVKGE